MGANPLLISTESIVFFDANCLLCSRFVKILLKFDKQKLHYSGFESEIARQVLPEELRDNPQTIVFYQHEALLFKSKAIFKIISNLRLPWPILGVFRILPSSFTDLIYNWVARHRLSWFGRSESCFLPTNEQKSRFFE